MCVFFLLSSLPRLNSVSVVFDFNDSLNDVAPVSPMLLAVDVKRNEKSELLMDAICVSSFFLSSPLRLSSVSVVFVFNDSLNDVTPVSPTSLSVGEKGKEKSDLFMDAICVSSFFCHHPPDRVP